LHQSDPEEEAFPEQRWAGLVGLIHATRGKIATQSPQRFSTELF
jgi:hypothetical protein